MAKYHFDVGQRSAEWHQLRSGIPTASSFNKIYTAGGKDGKKAKSSDQSSGYMNLLLAEWILGRSLESEYQSHWMERGEELEGSAVHAYEFQTGNETEECGFVTTDDGLVGCSPDRLVGEAGGCEIKAPAPQTHVASLLNQDMADGHRCQVQGCIWVAEREWWDIVSYHPQLPPVIIRVHRDDEYISKLSTGVREFVDKMLERRQELETRFGPFTRPELPKPKQVDDMEGLGFTEEDIQWFATH